MADQYGLLREIEQKRQVLIYVVAQEGLTSPAAVRYSQELDELLNRYDRLFTKLTGNSSCIEA